MSGEIVVDPTELADARWFAPEELPTVPPKLSIASELIDDFVRAPSTVMTRGFAAARDELGPPAELVLERVRLAERDRRDQVAEHRRELERVAGAAGRDHERWRASGWRAIQKFSSTVSQ